MLESLLARNIEWSAARHDADPGYFARLAALQAPEFFWIGCSDSRVPANVVAGLDPGEVFGFLGPNGAGKSTTMRMIAGVLEPDSGDATIDGKSIVSARREAQAALGYLPEGAPLYDDMTPPEFLAFMAAARSLPRSERKSAIERAIADSRISTVCGQRIGSLSKGYRRRVGLAGAIGIAELGDREADQVVQRWMKVGPALIAVGQRVVQIEKQDVGDVAPGVVAVQHGARQRVPRPQADGSRDRCDPCDG